MQEVSTSAARFFAAAAGATSRFGLAKAFWGLAKAFWGLAKAFWGLAKAFWVASLLVHPEL